MFPPKMRSLLSLSLGVLVLAAIPGAALAQIWNEVGDAGDLPATAQMTVGSGLLTQITGQLTNAEDEDVFCIQILDRNDFIAGILCAGMTDPEIWLFDTAGMGVSYDDVCAGGYKQITGLLVPGPGTYFLAVGCHGRMPQSPSGSIWLPNLFTGQRAPDGPGAPGPITGWAGGGLVTLPNYTINLLGATFCSMPTPAEARTWGTIKALYR